MLPSFGRIENCTTAMEIETFQNDMFPDSEISVALFENVTNCNDLKKLAMTGALDATLLNPYLVRNTYYRSQCGRCVYMPQYGDTWLDPSANVLVTGSGITGFGYPNANYLVACSNPILLIILF